MQIQEILRLANWYQENLIDSGIQNQYNALSNILKTNAANNNQAIQPFEAEKDTLIASLSTVNLNALTLEQVGFLDGLGIPVLLGPNGVHLVKQILFENVIDLATAAKKIQVNAAAITAGHKVLSEIFTVLSKSFDEDDALDIPEDTVMMRVYFQDGVAIENIKDLKRLSSTWYEIGRGIAMAQNKTPEDFNIVGAQKGSIIIEMAVLAALATSVSTILIAGLKVAEHVLEIKKKAEEIKLLKLSSNKAVLELEREAKTEKEKGIELIVDAALKELNLTRGSNGDKVVALTKSVTKLVDFTEKGGAVDFVEEEDFDDEDEQEETELRKEVLKIRSNVQEIRRLENRIKLLEQGNGNEE